MAKQDNKKKRHPIRNFIVDLIIILIIFVAALYLYSKYVGTKGIVVKEYRLSSNEIPIDYDGAKMIFITDLLLGSTVSIEDVEKIKDEINLFDPDLVIFGGNLLSKGYKISDEDKLKLRDTLKQIDAKIGKYAVMGDLDKDETKDILQNSSFHVLENSNDLIYAGESEPICIIGISSYILGKYDIESSFTCNENYKIVVSHEPDIIDKIKNLDLDVYLSGNTLGGEINIPFYGPLEKFEGSIKYYKDTNIGNIKVFISNGIGTRKYAKRLFNKPSFTLFRLKHEEQIS